MDIPHTWYIASRFLCCRFPISPNPKPKLMILVSALLKLYYIPMDYKDSCVAWPIRMYTKYFELEDDRRSRTYVSSCQWYLITHRHAWKRARTTVNSHPYRFPRRLSSGLYFGMFPVCVQIRQMVPILLTMFLSESQWRWMTLNPYHR